MEWINVAAAVAAAALLVISWDLRQVKQRMEERDRKLSCSKLEEPFDDRGDEPPEVADAAQETAQRHAPRP